LGNQPVQLEVLGASHQYSHLLGAATRFELSRRLYRRWIDPAPQGSTY